MTELSDSYWLPHKVQRELEPTGDIGTASVITVFLAAPRCAFRCVHCDLEQYALPGSAPLGSAVAQVRAALQQIATDPLAKQQPDDGPHWIKLYNAGNFSDSRSIPRDDYQPLARMLTGYQRVIVENHPRLSIRPLQLFASLLPGRLEVALGLETSDQQRLAHLNKQMTPADYVRTTAALMTAGIDHRAFIIAGGLGTTESDWRDDVRQSTRFALEHGARHVSIIPMRRDRVPFITLPNVSDFALKELLAELLQETKRSPRSCHDGVTPCITVDTWDFAPSPVVSEIAAINLTQSV